MAVTNGEMEILGHLAEPCDVRRGPEAVLDRALELLGKLREQVLTLPLVTAEFSGRLLPSLQGGFNCSAGEPGTGRKGRVAK